MGLPKMPEMPKMPKMPKKNCVKLGLTDLPKFGVPHPCPILCLVIFDYWETWLKLV